VSYEKAEITQEVTARYFHAVQSLHGSVYFKMLDNAVYFSEQSIIQDAFIYTCTLNIQLLRVIKSGIIKGNGTITLQSKSLYIADAILYDEKNWEMARGSGTFMKSQFPLDEKLWYR